MIPAAKRGSVPVIGDSLSVPNGFPFHSGKLEV